MSSPMDAARASQSAISRSSRCATSGVFARCTSVCSAPISSNVSENSAVPPASISRSTALPSAGFPAGRSSRPNRRTSCRSSVWRAARPRAALPSPRAPAPAQGGCPARPSLPVRRSGQRSESPAAFRSLRSPPPARRSEIPVSIAMRHPDQQDVRHVRVPRNAGQEPRQPLPVAARAAIFARCVKRRHAGDGEGDAVADVIDVPRRG